MKHCQLSSQNQRHSWLSRIGSYLAIISVILILNSCNSGSKEEKKTGTDTTTVPTDPNANGGGPVKAVIGTFYKYKIAKAQIDFAYTKLVLVPVLDNLADPSAMSLYSFPERSAGLPLVGAPIRAKTLPDPAAAFGTMGIMITNNEITLADFDWTNIDYITLEPTRSVDNLSFNVVAYDDQGGLPPIIVPPTVPAGNQSKPSPPAPPAFIPAAEKAKDKDK
ncbi:MAG: hypothetical protein ABIR30_09190 [Chitinophagaceae bacterium]